MVYIITLRVQALQFNWSRAMIHLWTDARNYVTQNSLFSAANHNTAHGLR